VRQRGVDGMRLGDGKGQVSDSVWQIDRLLENMMIHRRKVKGEPGRFYLEDTFAFFWGKDSLFGLRHTGSTNIRRRRRHIYRVRRYSGAG